MKSSHSIKSRAAATGKYTSLVVYSLITLVPLVVLVITSLKTKKDYATSGPLDLPRHVTFANFKYAFVQGDMASAFINTTIILVISTVASIIIGTMAAYAISRFNFRFKKTVVAAFLLAALVPAVTTQVATFQVVNALGVYDTRKAAIILFTSTDIVSIYIFIQFMRSIPISLDEAAKLDGCNHFTIYRKIILPLLRPAIATVVIIKGIAIYNEFYIPYLYMPDQNLGVVSTSLQRFIGPRGTEWEQLSAGALIVIVPTLVIFLVLQKQIYNGISAGATK
ncbi:carbohydrate ABC transporter permease [Dermatophilaceae bacterium Sec6.4]|nr:carbohydrate ABC transporter permease [Actinomycetota bacterium]